MSNVEQFYPANAANNPDNVLEQAMGIYERILIFGHDKNGDLDVRASLNMSPEDMIFLLELVKHKILAGDYAE